MASLDRLIYQTEKRLKFRDSDSGMLQMVEQTSHPIAGKWQYVDVAQLIERYILPTPEDLGVNEVIGKLLPKC